ncbi:MAG: 3-dehydroquinate synthase [Bacteroidia bacterium]
MKAKLNEDARLNVSLGKVSVPLYVGCDIFSEIASIIPLNNYTRMGVLMDDNIAYHWGGAIRKVLGKNIACIVIPAGEEHKSLSTAEMILASMIEHGFDRKSLLINIGGGVVCDIGGFAASAYMRGISFVNVPTTLLAQADAAIGGKTGVDFGGFKNMVGSFAHPVAVICDSLLLSTLPEREFRSGFSEVIKHALVADRKLFHTLAEEDFGAMDEDKLAEILIHSAKIKCGIVSKDADEKGLRKILNFGHTIGHAIEMLSQDTNNPLLHGEAISIGIIAEAKLSQLSGFISKEDFQRIEHIISKASLPSEINRSYKKKIYDKMLGDKKNEKKKIKWVLLNGIGNAVIDEEQPISVINKAIDYIIV